MKTVRELQSQYDEVSNLDMPERDKNDTLEAIEGEIEIASKREAEFNALMPIESVNAIELFKSRDTLQHLLDEIKNVSTDFEPDLESVGGRKEIASRARKVSSAKVVIDNARRSLVAKKKAECALIDASGKHARDFCDDLRDEIRKPLTWWEGEQKRIVEEKFQQDKLERDEKEAYAMHDLWLREQAVVETEARLEAERIERERVEREVREAKKRQEREDRLQKEAAERATREAEERIQAERTRAEQAERAAKDAVDRAKREKVEAAQRAEQARLDGIENERIRVAQKKAQEDFEKQQRETNTKHKRKINIAAKKVLMENGISDSMSEKFIKLVAGNKIPRMRIDY